MYFVRNICNILFEYMCPKLKIKQDPTQIPKIYVYPTYCNIRDVKLMPFY